MNNFEKYLVIGNTLEDDGRYLVAYTIYLEALKYADSDSYKTLESYLESFHNYINFNFSKLNSEIKEQFLIWIRNGSVNLCAISFSHLFENLDFAKWTDNDNCIIYHWISMQKNNTEYINITFDSIKSEYYMVKFLVRRIEMKFSGIDDLINYIREHNFSNECIDYIIRKTCFFPSVVYKELMDNLDYSYYKRLYECATDDSTSIKLERTTQPGHNYGDFAIIVAVSDEDMYAECMYYINHLNIPEKCRLTVHPIRNASSMTEAYNIGCGQSNARYKIYIHQDTMIVNKNLLYELLDIFETPEIGIAGVAGVSKMPESCIWWESKEDDNYRNLFQDTLLQKGHTLINPLSKPFQNVCVLDGVFLATQYDIPWRNDLFDGWHYYDMSQCMEFKKRGFGAVVVKQSFPWCLHEQKCNKTLGEDFDKYRSVFQKEYCDFL